MKLLSKVSKLLFVFGLLAINGVGAIQLNEINSSNVVALTKEEVKDFIQKDGKSAINTIFKSITKENISKVPLYTIGRLVDADKNLVY